MKITAQEEYGLRCLLRLAKAESGVATLPEIAVAEGLSQPYVAKLMAVLRNAGIIESTRGRTGGYRLAQPIDTVGLGTLLQMCIRDSSCTCAATTISRRRPRKKCANANAITSRTSVCRRSRMTEFLKAGFLADEARSVI